MANHVPGRPFALGASGNPHGRPPVGRSLAECIRRLGGDDGRLYVDALHRIATADEENAKTRIAAIQMLLERGYGKPPDNMATSSETFPTIHASQLTTHQLEVLQEILLKAQGA